MEKRNVLIALVGGVSLGLLGAYGPRLAVGADKAAPAGDAKGAAVTCKAHNGKACCDPAVAAHLSKSAVFKACGESDATFLGEEGSKDTCKYVFKVEGEKEGDAFVQVYAPAQKEVPSEPTDPFFSWKKVGKVFITEKAKSPKAAPMIANATGLWLPGKGYTVSVNASTKVCTKPEVKKLASEVK